MSLSDSFAQLGHTLSQIIEEQVSDGLAQALQNPETLSTLKESLQLEQYIQSLLHPLIQQQVSQNIEETFSKTQLPQLSQQTEALKMQLLEQGAMIEFYKEVLQKYKVQFEALTTSQDQMMQLIQEQNKKIKHLEKENMSFQSESAKNRIFFVERYEQLQDEIDLLKDNS